METKALFDAAMLIRGLYADRILAAAQFFDSSIYLQWFEKRFPRALEAFYLCGIHPTRPRSLYDPFAKTDAGAFPNIGLHGLAVGLCAARIAGRMLGVGAISHNEAALSIERALIHDVAKPFELFRQRAFRTDRRSATRFAQPEDIEQGLRSLHPPLEMIAYIAGAGNETGGDTLPSLLRSSAGAPYLISGELPRKIVHFVDNMTLTPFSASEKVSRSTFLTCAERLVAGNNHTRYPHMLTDMLVEHSDGSVELILDLVHVPEGARLLGSVFGGEIYAARLIAKELAAPYGLDPSACPEQYLKAIANSNRGLPDLKERRAAEL